MSGRTSTLAGDLARRGFNDVGSIGPLVGELDERHPNAAPDWVDLVAATGDPDLAVQGLARLDEAHRELADEILTNRGWLARTVAVLGGSLALNQHLRAHPEHLRVLAEQSRRLDAAALQESVTVQVGASGDLDALVLDDPQAADRLRLANKRELVRIAARDLSHPNPTEIVDEIAAELADLADVVLRVALAIARALVPEHDRARLGVVALGKCGARELNYLSDIDVLYVAEPTDDRVSVEDALRTATKLAAAASRVCSAHSAAGTIWQVDAALRPDGNAGPLVRTIASHRTYYEKWAKNWEFQAMLKARPMAGDLDLAEQFCRLVDPLVWQVGGQPNFMTDVQAMRQRVVSLIPARERDREMKLGAGGLRDIEFSVQLLQLVHGRIDTRLRSRGTLESLHALMSYGYIGRADAASLDASYRFLRVLEHREQLFRLRRTHLLPDNETDLNRLARQVGVDGGPALLDTWRQMTRRNQKLQQRVFYSPLLEAVSRLSGDELKLSTDAAADRLRALGFSDPAAALRHIEALTTGLSRTAEIQRQLMPAMLRWFSEGPNPDLGILTFRRLSDEMGATSWYLRALRDEGAMAERLARIVASSRYISELLRRDPSVVQLLAGEELDTPRTFPELVESMRKVTARHDGAPAAAIAAVRGLRRRELFRLAAGDVLGSIDLAALGQGLSDLAGATVHTALAVARAEAGSGIRIGVVAMGRWGGREMSYASDADAMFVVPDDTEPEQLAEAERIIARVRTMLGQPGPEAPLELDADLRPEGRNGRMVRTLGGYLSYYEKWSSTWESQALLRATYGAGDAELVSELLGALESRRYPACGVSQAQVTEIRRLKARMENERAGRGAAGKNLKLGAGGLSDVEWTVQLLQLRHAGRLPELRRTDTMGALAAAQRAGLLDADDAESLRRAWLLASELRNKSMLVRGRAGDTLPSDVRETASVAMLLGYDHGHASALMEAWARTARHAAQVVDRLFWGNDR